MWHIHATRNVSSSWHDDQDGSLLKWHIKQALDDTSADDTLALLTYSRKMSKYDPLWHHVEEQEGPTLLLSFEQVEEILGFPIDHSFLNYKKELLDYGWQVGKISLKAQTVSFSRVPD